MNKRAMNKRMPIFLVLLCAAAAAVLLACGWKTMQSPRVIYVAWSNNQESYSFKSIFRKMPITARKGMYQTIS